MLDMIYDKKNNFLKPYNFKLDFDKKSYADSGISYKNNDKSLFINRTTKRFIANDGMHLNVSGKLINNNDVKASNSNNYGVCNLSCLFDVINMIPISYHLTESTTTTIEKKKVNETNGFLQQISILNSNDIILFDRWYHSKKLVNELNSKDIGYVFRMKSNSKLFKGMKCGKSKIINYCDRKVQLFKYKIKNEEYYIMTSIVEKISINEIKALYWKRWTIETNNKKFKYDILSTNIRSKKHNSLMVDIEIVKFISIMSAVIEYTGKDSNSRNKINSKNCLDQLYNRLLKIFLYGTDTDEENKNISMIIGVIYNVVTQIVKNRSYKRIRVSPST